MMKKNIKLTILAAIGLILIFIGSSLHLSINDGIEIAELIVLVWAILYSESKDFKLIKYYILYHFASYLFINY